MQLPIHREWMLRALAEAAAAPATRDVPVGAIVVDADGVVVAAALVSRGGRPRRRPATGG